jgi:hypothetical protein
MNLLLFMRKYATIKRPISKLDKITLIIKEEIPMMTMRKILAVALCVLAMLSVMAIVANAAVDPSRPPDAETTTPGTTTPQKPLSDQIMEWWESTKVWLEPLYRFSFQGFSKALVAAFQGLLALVGLNFWQGGLFGFLA